MDQIYPEVLTLRQAAELMHKDRETVAALCETGRLPCYRPGTPSGRYRHYRIQRRDVLAYQIRELEWQLRAAGHDRELPELLTVGQACEVLGLSVAGLYERIKRGEIGGSPSPRGRRMPWLPRDVILAYRERNREGAAQTA